VAEEVTEKILLSQKMVIERSSKDDSGVAEGG